MKGKEPIAICGIVNAAVVRIASNPRVFRPAVDPKDAFEFLETWSSHPRAVQVAPGERHWRIFRDLVLSHGVRGSDTTDAYLAAIALEHGCTWWTTDGGFSRFEALSSRNLLEG